jgi:hypothetical protein
LAGWAITVSAAGAATDPGVRAGLGAGDPVPGLTADQMTLFLDGQATFAEIDAVGDGLGPRTSDPVQAIQLHASGGVVRNNTVATTDATANRGGGGWNTTAPSEANRVIASFNSSSNAQQQDLLNFLRSL